MLLHHIYGRHTYTPVRKNSEGRSIFTYRACGIFQVCCVDTDE
jgi:hypothetical protein